MPSSPCHSQLGAYWYAMFWMVEPSTCRLQVFDLAVAQKTGTKMGCPGKWKHGPKPADCPSCLILSHLYVCVQAQQLHPPVTPFSLDQLRGHCQGYPPWLDRCGKGMQASGATSRVFRSGHTPSAQEAFMIFIADLALLFRPKRCKPHIKSKLLLRGT